MVVQMSTVRTSLKKQENIDNYDLKHLSQNSTQFTAYLSIFQFTRSRNFGEPLLLYRLSTPVPLGILTLSGCGLAE